MTRNTLLACRPAPDGLGVYSLRAIDAGRRILEFTGPVLDKVALDAALAGASVDNFLQISANRYMGPSGGMDDFVNHSCDPNCGLQFLDSGVVLITIRPIRPGEEITFDYATTQNAYPYRFSCACGSPKCRLDIGDFDDLPYALKSKYHDRGILAPYLAARFAGALRDAAAKGSWQPLPRRRLRLT